MKEERKGTAGLILAAAAGGAAVWAWLRQNRTALSPESQMPTELPLAEELARQRGPQFRQRVPATRKTYDVSALGDNVIISGARGYCGCIYEFNLYNPISQDIDIREDEESIQPLPEFPGGAGFTLHENEQPHWILKDGASLILNLGGGSRVTGFVKYRLLPPSEIS